MYISSLPQNAQAVITLWTDQNFCSFLNNSIRGYAQPSHIETVTAFLQELRNNGYNYAGINLQNVQALSQSQTTMNRNRNLIVRERILRLLI